MLFFENIFTAENKSPSPFEQSNLNVGLANLARRKKILQIKNNIEKTPVKDDKKTSSAKRLEASLP